MSTLPLKKRHPLSSKPTEQGSVEVPVRPEEPVKGQTPVVSKMLSPVDENATLSVPEDVPVKDFKPVDILPAKVYLLPMQTLCSLTRLSRLMRLF